LNHAKKLQEKDFAKYFSTWQEVQKECVQENEIYTLELMEKYSKI